LSFYKNLLFPIISKIDPERIHYYAMDALQFFYKIPGAKSLLKYFFSFEEPSLEKNVMGLKFKNPVGLAAGFDKNGKWINELSTLGFGFIEIGTVTPLPQEGNPKPRLFRLKSDEALINRMGFNNHGIKEVVENLKKVNAEIIIGGNIGKNKITDNANANTDYILAYEALYDYVDYFVVNVSSPNTPGLRELQEKEPLMHLLSTIQSKNQSKTKPKPILLKIAPDLTDSQLDDIVEIVKLTKIEGVIATNTTLSREDLKADEASLSEIGAGGLSGKPLKDRATQVIQYLKNKSENSFVIIGVGGIYSAEDAIEKLKAGASLVQVYSGFVYEGPSLAKTICKGLHGNLNFA